MSLSPLTVLPCSPLEIIDAASAAGFRTLGLRLLPTLPTDVAVLEDPELMRGILRRLRETQLSVLDVEVIRVSPSLDVGTVLPVLDYAAELGARWLAVTAEPRDDYRAETEHLVVSKLRDVADAAARRGLGVMLEFMVFRGVSTLDDAVRVVTAVDRPNMRICLDVLHLFRSGGTAESVRKLDPQLLACVQLNDAPIEPTDDVQREARYNRRLPGQGGLPLDEVLAAIPVEVPLAVEVPAQDAAPLAPAQRAHAAMAALRSVL
ncbi:MAG: sugar phosphate isomerase/epimerase family protein [Actinomycetales bacterium]